MEHWARLIKVWVSFDVVFGLAIDKTMSLIQTLRENPTFHQKKLIEYQLDGVTLNVLRNESKIDR